MLLIQLSMMNNLVM